jgi:hypothetical protein
MSHAQADAVVWVVSAATRAGEYVVRLTRVSETAPVLVGPLATPARPFNHGRLELVASSAGSFRFLFLESRYDIFPAGVTPAERLHRLA